MGRLTVVKNVKTVSDLVAARSVGFVRGYEILYDGLAQGSRDVYEVRILAEVQAEAPSSDATEPLRLFLEVLGQPTVLVILPDAMVAEPNPLRVAPEPSVRIRIGEPDSREPVRPGGLTALGENVDDHGSLRAAESAIAQGLLTFGYAVITSDEVRPDTVPSSTLARARRGVTADVLEVARRVGADLVLTGLLRVSSQRIEPQGVAFVSTTMAASVKAFVASNSLAVDAYSRTLTRAHTSTLGSISALQAELAQDLTRSLAWKLPSILAQRPRQTTIWIDNVTFDQAQAIKGALEGVEGVESSRFESIPTASRPAAGLLVFSAYVLPDPVALAHACGRAVSMTCVVLEATKFDLRLRLVS